MTGVIFNNKHVYKRENSFLSYALHHLPTLRRHLWWNSVDNFDAFMGVNLAQRLRIGTRWFSLLVDFHIKMCLKSSKGRYLNLYKSIKFRLHTWASSHDSFFSWVIQTESDHSKILYQLKTVCYSKTSLLLISFIIAPSCWHVLYDTSRVEKEDGTFISQMCLLNNFRKPTYYYFLSGTCSWHM